MKTVRIESDRTQVSRFSEWVEFVRRRLPGTLSLKDFGSSYHYSPHVVVTGTGGFIRHPTSVCSIDYEGLTLNSVEYLSDMQAICETFERLGGPERILRYYE